MLYGVFTAAKYLTGYKDDTGEELRPLTKKEMI